MSQKTFLKKYYLLKKKIISISPLAGFKHEEILSNFDLLYKEEIEKILKTNNFESYIQLNIAFLKTIQNLNFCILGTKNYKRFKDLEVLIKNTIKLNNENFFKILSLQEKYKTVIDYK